MDSELIVCSALAQDHDSVYFFGVGIKPGPNLAASYALVGKVNLEGEKQWIKKL